MELIKKLNSNEITFSAPFGNDGKNYSKILLNNNKDKQVYFVTNYLKSPFGPSQFKDDFTNWSASLSLEGNEEDKELNQNFFTELEKLENKLIDHALTHTVKAFNKNHKNRDVVEACFNRTIKLSLDKTTKEPDGKYPSRISPKFDIRDGKLKTIIKDSKNKTITVNELTDLPTIIGKHSLIKAIIKPNIYYIGGKFGMSLKFHTIKFKVNQNQPLGNELDSDCDEEEEKSSEQKAVEEKQTTQTLDSDDEDDNESSSDDDDDDNEETEETTKRGKKTNK
jgi:hypothetical protein